MHLPGPLPSISDMIIDRPTLLNSPYPYSALQTTTDQPAAPPPLPRAMHSIWTVQMVTQLVQLRSQRLSWSRISTHFLGKTGNACRKRYERHRKRILGRMSVIEASDGRDVTATSAELITTSFPPVFGHATTTSTAATALTPAQAQMFASRLKSVNYSNMTRAQVLQMHNHLLHGVLEIPLLRYRASVSPSFTSVDGQSAQAVGSPLVLKYLPWNNVTDVLRG